MRQRMMALTDRTSRRQTDGIVVAQLRVHWDWITPHFTDDPVTPRSSTAEDGDGVFGMGFLWMTLCSGVRRSGSVGHARVIQRSGEPSSSNPRHGCPSPPPLLMLMEP
jgi:hypothetical protein